MKVFNTIFFSLALVATSLSSARAQDFLNDAQHMFFDKTMLTRRYGIEIEFGGVADQVIEKIILDKLGGRVVERMPTGELVFETPYGEVRLKIEGQAWRYEEDPKRYAEQQAIDRLKAPREIVFPPLDFSAADAIQSVGLALKGAGAIGTTDTNAVSTQVNVEMPGLVNKDGTDDAEAVKNLVDMMRVYSDPEHFRQIEDKIHVPAVRREYILDYSAGMRARLSEATYKPTARELFDDYFYRQSLELLGFKEAWSMDLEAAKTLLLSQKDPVVPAVAKMLRLRVSSLMLLAFPADPLTVAIIRTRWAKPMPLVEFREMNTDFDIKSTIEQCLGIVRSVEVFGDYDHDELVSKLTGIDSRDLAQLRANATRLKARLDVVRYSLQDPKAGYDAGRNEGLDIKEPLWLQLDPRHTGRVPLVVGGNSVVYNRRNIHRDTITGKYNPGLENAQIQQALENKLFEAKVFGKYARGAMPRYSTLSELTAGNKVSPANLLRLLNVEFPNGWVMKSAFDLSTESMFISDLLDLSALIKEYRKGFEAFRSKTEKAHEGENPEVTIEALKTHPGYRGWKIVEMLSQPDQVFFQERLRIKREYRVEVQGGKVLSRGSTIDRYAYKEKSPTPPSKAEIDAVEKYTQNLVDRLPEVLRIIPYAFDVALIENGEFKVIETNPGGNSSFLEENPASQEALDAYLRTYPKLVDSGLVKTLTPEEQMTWIKTELKELGLDAVKHYPGMDLGQSDIRDTAYPPVFLKKNEYRSTAALFSSINQCERLLSLAKP